jgi:hypothetical protein
MTESKPKLKYFKYRAPNQITRADSISLRRTVQRSVLVQHNKISVLNQVQDLRP